MKAKIIIPALTLLALVALGVCGLSTWVAASGQSYNQNGDQTGDQTSVQGVSRITATGFGHLKRPAALFDHDEHNDTAGIDECAVCHHVWENGQLVADESSEDSSCSECHGLNSKPGNSMALANAFHTQCRTCHIDGGKGPLLCGQCHRKIYGGE